MQDPGHLIATSFLIMYTILGPLVLFAIYVLFDSLSKSTKPHDQNISPKDPALWTGDDITTHLHNAAEPW